MSFPFLSRPFTRFRFFATAAIAYATGVVVGDGPLLIGYAYANARLEGIGVKPATSLRRGTSVVTEEATARVKRFFMRKFEREIGVGARGIRMRLRHALNSKKKKRT